MDESFDRLLSGTINVEQYMDESSLSNHPDSLDDKDRASFDMVMRSVNSRNLLEPLLGVNVEGASDVFKLYFSQSAEQKKLEELVEELTSLVQNVRLSGSDDPAAKYMIIVQNPQIREDPLVSGQVSTELEIQGTVDVTRGA